MTENSAETDLLAIGDSSIDLFMKIDPEFVANPEDKENPEICFYHGSKIPVEKFETSIAGNACHISLACAKLGMQSTIYTELGEDSNGERIISELSKNGVNTSFCIKNKGTPTNVHSIIVSGKGGERTIFSYHEKRNYKIYAWPKPKWLFYSSLAKGFDGFQANLVDYLKKNPKIGVAFNPGTQQLREGIDSLRNILEVTDILFVNKEEAQRLTNVKEQSIEKLHEYLHALGPKLTVITLGMQGSTAHDGTKMLSREIYQEDKEIVDKTGAGDSYAAAFLAALYFGKNLETAMKWGAINSSHVIREIGAIKGLLNKEQLSNKANMLT
jgi:sugar/nucleoside kinase (ribokinase family)